jgi:predicted dehydrogenase
MGEGVRIAIAGPGWIGAVHARAIAQTAGAELVAVLGSDEGRASAFARSHGASRVHVDLADLCADREVDAVVLATPNHLHCRQGVPLLEAGKHLLVEKPLARGVAEGERLARSAAAAGRVLAVGHMWRFDREAQRLRAAVDDGVLGRVVKTKGYGIHTRWGPGGWFTDPERAGGGALIDMGVHAIDTVRYLLGDPEPARVYAHLGTCFGDYEVDDLGVLMIEWRDGPVSLIESGWWNPHSDGPEASTQLFGTAGYARLFPTELFRVAGEGMERVPLEFPERSDHCDPHLYAGQMAEFVASIASGGEPAAGAAQGLAVLRICEAAYTSSREHRAVDL